MLHSTAGSKLYIGSERLQWSARDLMGADMGVDSWVDIGGLVSLGRIAGAWRTEDIEVIQHDEHQAFPVLNTEVDKVARPAATMQIVADIVEDDAGQLAMIRAEASLNPFGFRIVLSSGATRMFVALVVGMEHAFDEANSLPAYLFTLRLQSNVARAA